MNDLYLENKKYFQSPIAEFVYFDKYSRWRDDLGRREIWPESVNRVVDFLKELSAHKLPQSDYDKISQYILSGDISPSMRLFAVAGKEARRNNVSCYNCAYVPIVDLSSISELLWLSMSGVGVGFSVESRYTDLLPIVALQDGTAPFDFIIDDSAKGWVDAFLFGMNSWFSGKDVKFNYSFIRPSGAILKTRGGTSSGPGVLRDLLDFTRELILKNQNNKLRPIDVFDICTSVGSCAVSGGSRRSAMLTMFDIDDEDMLHAKSGEFWNEHINRTNANISVVIENRLSMGEVASLMNTMFDSGVGEPGLVSRRAMNLTKPERRRHMEHGGVNGCSEINLHGTTSGGEFGGQMCNLSTVQVYAHDTEDTLREKIRLAGIVGTIQSVATDFTVLRPTWQEICEEERLLGVSIIGVMDNKIVREEPFLKELRDIVVETNKKYAKLLNINQSAATTSLKPSGNSSVMYSVARGINARYAPYYIRRVRVNAHTPMCRVLRDSGVPMEPENGQTEKSANTYVAVFYEKSPDGAITIDDLTAIDQLNYWKMAKMNFSEHNISVTIEYEDSEKSDIIDWVFQNQDIVNGIAFLPRSEHIYLLAPYEKITQQEYEAAIESYPSIDFSLLMEYEIRDTTTRTIDCSAGVCDLA